MSGTRRRLLAAALGAMALGIPGRARQKYGVPQARASSHTASVGGYAIKGHVPSADIKRLPKKRPQARGLAVPGMPQDARGMDLGKEALRRAALQHRRALSGL